MSADDATITQYVQELAPQVLAIVARRSGQFDLAEDAVQEALLAAASQWPVDGIPEHPRAWLVMVASRRLIDLQRSESARREREAAAALDMPEEQPGPDPRDVPDADDTLTLFLLCCHPALSPASQVALTLRAIGGLTTAQVAAAFLVPEATMAQRISRAKAAIRAAGARFSLPPPEERDARLRAMLHVLYLMFTEGSTATSGPDAHRADLVREAIRLARMAQRAIPADAEVGGLLALMLLTDARRAARLDGHGDLVPLEAQNRSRWDRAAIAEGLSLIGDVLGQAPVGPYQVQAAIAAVHAEAVTAAETDWAQIVALYEVLERIAPSPVVTLNRAVAVGMAQGPEAGLALLTPLADDARLARSHRLAAVRAGLLERAGNREAARTAYRAAAALARNVPERRYLERQAARLAGPGDAPRDDLVSRWPETSR